MPISYLQPDLIKGFTTAPIATAPSAPAVGYVNLYFKTDNKLYYQNSAGAETEIAGGGTGIPLTVQDNGTNVTTNTEIVNFTGSGASVSNVGGIATVNIPGSINTERILSTTVVNALATGSTVLYTIPPGKTFLISKAIVSVGSFIGTSGTLNCGFGVNSSPYNLFVNTDLVGLNSSFNSWMFQNTGGGFDLVSSGDQIKITIATALTGTTADINVYLLGVDL